MMKNLLFLLFSALLFLGCSDLATPSDPKSTQLTQQNKDSNSSKKIIKTKKITKKSTFLKSSKRNLKSQHKATKKRIISKKAKKTIKKRVIKKRVIKKRVIKKKILKKKVIKKIVIKKRNLKKKSSKKTIVKKKVKKKKIIKKKVIKKKIEKKRIPKQTKKVLVLKNIDDSLVNYSRFLIYTPHAQVIYIQEALGISAENTKQINTMKEALRVKPLDKETTLIYLSDLKHFQAIHKVSTISDHLAKKSFWFISYKNEAAVSKFKKVTFNGLKTSIIFIHEDDFDGFVQSIQKESTLKQLIQSNCSNTQECRSFSLGNHYLLY